MKADPRGVLVGVHFMDGDHACCEGALAAGCRAAFGYPITPSTEVVERIARRLPLVGGVFIQMEDEIASSIAIQGAAWGGMKVMTVSSGPGISLMMEHIGFAAMTETPCVFVNVQRVGPSTGLPTQVAQGDMMQARWGSHGDYEIIAVCPNSPQECFDLTVQAFNLSERYRVPVLFMMDESVGHMTERVVIPQPEQIEIEARQAPSVPKEDFLPYEPKENMVPEMPTVGDGYKVHVTGLTHNEKGYPIMNTEVQDKLVRRLVDKIRLQADDICLVEEDRIEDAEIIIVAYGITSRVVLRSLQLARDKGLKVGVFRPVIVWPFPEKRLRELA
jgi:2-oxoglutarate/2-oxoacid ferredoxin oxidoreductase subunit alpha